MNLLKDKTAIVTGASSGIGRAAARLFASEGAAIVATARRRTELDALISEIESSGGRAIAVSGDVKDEAHAKAAVDAALECFGGLDVAFNNAGTMGEMAAVTELPLADWRETLETNLTGAFLGAKHQARIMTGRGHGSIIFTSSFVGYSAGLAGTAAYSASKAGLIGLTKALAGELGGNGVRVNAILPGGTDTPANIANAPDAGAEIRTFVENLHALKRMASPDEIAQSAMYLASDASSFVTGATMLVDGGVSIARG